jgi:hypothetical protein
VPVLSLSGFVIRRIFAYCSHSVAIDEKGRVFVCGSNNYGQLGLGDVRKANTFQVLHVFDEHPVITASLGDTFTAFLTESFELYTCGDGDESRLCNTAIGKVRIPTPADAAIGRSVMWMSCGCSHMIIAENLEEVPRHPGRSHFGLDGANRRKHRKLPSLMKSQPVVHLTKPVLADVSDFGTLWTGFLNGDIVRTGDFGEGIVVGMTSRGLAVEFRDGVRLFDLKDLRTVFGKLQIKKRDGAMFTQAVTRASARLPLDVSEGSCQVFGFVPGDRVEHPLLGGAIIQGMFGGGLWLAFDDDAGAIVTTLVNEPAYLHQWLKICQPNNRSIAYLSIGGQSWPVETAPCRVLHLYGLALGDLVDTGNSVGIIQGSFRFLAVVANALTGDLVLVPPPGILLLRHFGTAPVIVERLALNGSGVEIDVSCSESDEFMPFDRVVTQRGHATIVGRAEGKIWLATDDASALGGGAGTLPDTSQFRLVRRIAAKGVSKTGLSVSSDDFRGSRILPDDEVLVKGGRYIVLGMNNEKLVGIKSVSGGGTYLFPLSDFDECQIVYRADIPATRAYHSRAGTRLTLSVSLRDFLGKRFIPDDVIETPLGVGLVVGITDANVAIHLSGDDGVSFFTPQAIYDTALFKLKQRRAISSVIKRKDELA